MVAVIAKKKREITVRPVGYSSESVTGSCNLIEYNDTTIAVELGGIQEGHSVLENYNMNKRMLSKIRPQDLNYIFVCHLHFDHIFGIPAMFSSGKCNANVIVPKGSTSILREMWLDSAKISEKDCENLCRKSDKLYTPFYTSSDVEQAISHIKEFGSDEIFNLTDELSFRYTPAGHIMLSQQLELFINLNNHVSKILVTSDLGNTITESKRIFVEDFKPVQKANIVLGESTYGSRISKTVTKKIFEKDLEKIKTVIDQYCIDNHSRVLIPTFSLDKTPIVLWYLYEMFGNDETFNVPIIVDSPLAIRLLQYYSSILSDEAKIKFDEMMNWKNINLITDYKESAACIKDYQPKVIISAGGMLQSGRSVVWAQNIIPRSNDCILFSGYCGENTLGWKIKHAKDQKTISINGAVVKNKCQIVEISSMSGHIQRKELINYYKNIQCDTIYLLHGNLESRLNLKEDLEKEIANMSKTTKVKIVTKDMVIRL